jgi:alpha-L-fucosidase
MTNADFKTNLTGPFEPTVESLVQHQTPDWFRDAKFGIYTHWGPVSVGTARQAPGHSDTWYGRYMYIPGLSGPDYHGSIPGRTTFEDHRKNFGDQATFGFKDNIQQTGDWSDFTLNGDAAPNDRFNFRAKFPPQR